ncbi:MAG: M61 family metallopeptidase [Sphingomonadales bacterium]|nr:M61 family metallopeptidase [Sphingomonadales bacterium]
MRILAGLIFTFILHMSKAQNTSPIHYSLSIPEPHTHYVKVEMEIVATNKKEVQLSMPVWTPGSYLVREFSKSVERFEATTSGKPLSVTKTNKNTWSIAKGKAEKINVSYWVYAYEFSVRTSFVDADQALLNPSSICMLVQGMENNSGTLGINLPGRYSKISTALPKNKEGYYVFQHYDELADSPIQLGNHEEWSFDVRGIPHKVAMVGIHNADKTRFLKDLKTVCETMTDIVGVHPCKEYLFIVQNVEAGGGGLEHLNSTVVVMSRLNWKDESKYKSFLGLCAHEYFHLWNVKRIRPLELGPFNYSAENYTEQLWVAEGVTSYYDELAMLRAGFVKPAQFLATLEGYVNDLENRPGSKIQTLAQSSHDAWIKEYRPNENSKNTNISYYAKGVVVAALLDAKISSATQGKKNLDDLMRLLWKTYYNEKKRGFSVAEFEAAASDVAGTDLKIFFDKHVRSLETPDYQGVFNDAGITVNIKTDKRQVSGMSTALENGKTVVKFVESGTPAWNSGVNVNDEIVAMNGFRVNNDADDLLKKLSYPESSKLLVSRGGIIKELDFKFAPTGRFSLTLGFVKDKTSPALEKWLGKIN